MIKRIMDEKLTKKKMVAMKMRFKKIRLKKIIKKKKMDDNKIFNKMRSKKIVDRTRDYQKRRYRKIALLVLVIFLALVSTQQPLLAHYYDSQYAQYPVWMRQWSSKFLDTHKANDRSISANSHENTHFKLVNKVKYEQDTLYTFKHNKLGMEVIWIKNQDKRKSFALGVKTPSRDNTGVTHIIEHTVLTGSKKYPLNNLFFDAAEAYPHIYMNAFTSADLTIYPFCTPYDECYEQLMHIYLDSILNPWMLEQPNGFYQEGFHYNPETDSFGGVVYNEMKGAIKTKDRIIYRSIRKNVYKGTYYENDSGGLPGDIPKLTYEKFIDVYKEYYHPRNMKIVLYGDIPIAKVLSVIDSYISSCTCDGKEQDLMEEPQKTAEYMMDSYYSDSNKSHIIKSFLVRKKLTAQEQADLDLWVYTYLIHPNSYFQKQMKKLNIERAEIYQDKDLPYPIYSIVIKDVDPSKKQEYKEHLQKVLEEMKTKDIRNKDLEQDTINQYNIANKISESDSIRGIELARSILEAWAHEKDMDQAYIAKDYVHQLKAIDPKYKQLLLGDSEESLIELNPKSDMQEEEPKKISPVPEEKWHDIIKSLSIWQKEKNKTALKKVDEKRLMVIPENFTYVEEDKEISYIITPINTQLAQIQLYYDTTNVKQKDLPYLALYSYLLTESAKEMTPYKASFSIMPITIEKRDTYIPYIKISILTNSGVKDIDILLSNLRKELKNKGQAWYLNKLTQYISEFEEQQNENILQNLITIGNGSLKGANRYHYEMTYPVYELCKKLKADQDINWVEKVKSIDEVLNQNQRLKVGIACPKNHISKYKKAIQKLRGVKGKVNEKQIKGTVNKNKYDFKVMPKVNVYLMDTAVDYIYLLYQKDKPVNGIDYVAAAYLTNNYISPQIRLKNGAYGAGMNTSQLNIIGLYTYRDPDYIRSLEVFDKIGEQLKKIDEDSLECAKKEALSRVQNVFKLFANEITQADARERNLLGHKIEITDLQSQIIHATIEDIKKCADEYAQIPEKGVLSIATSKHKRIIFSEKRVYETQ